MKKNKISEVNGKQRQNTILHIDDNETHRYTVSKQLQRAGYHVVEADSGLSGLTAANENPNLIVLDVNLPDINGFSVCRQLKSNLRTSSIPVLYLSATRVHARDRTYGLEVGADAYLAEPVDEGEFLATVRALLRIRRAEQPSADLARQWQQTFDTIGDAICLLDRAGKVIRYNLSTEAMLETKQTLLGVDLKELIETRIGGTLTDDLTQEVGIGGKWFRVKRTPLPDGFGGVSGTVWTFADISAMKAIEIERKSFIETFTRSNEELNQFAHVASHDLKEPLRMISMYVHLLEKKVEPLLDSETTRYFEFVRRGALRMSALIDDILAYASIQTRPVQGVPTDLNGVLKDTLSNLDSALSETKAKVEVAKLPTVEADPIRVGQLFQNLIANAIKFRGREPPTVSISVKEGEKEWTFSVRDNGIGIAEPYHEKIFGIFTRLHSSKDYPGTGVGLATCKKIVEQHHGRLWVESQPGQGSSFSFTLLKS